MDSQPATPAPIFTDETGTRATVVQWLARGLCLSCALVAGAVAFTMLTHVPLPGLGGLLEPGKTASPLPSGRHGSEPDDRVVTGEVSSGSTVQDRSTGTQRVASTAVRDRPGAASATDSRGEAGAQTPSHAEATHPPAPANTPDDNTSTKGPSPHATTKSPNPHSVDKTKNSRAVAGSENGRASSRPTSTPSVATP